MSTTYALPCPTARFRCHSRSKRRAKSRIASRATTFALWVLAVVIMAYGARWTLEQPGAGAAEFTAATFVFDGPAHGVRAPASLRAVSSTSNKDAHHE